MNVGRIASLIFCLALFLTPLSARASSPLILGVHPYLPVSELMERFQPLARYLETIVRRPVQVRVGLSYEEHIQHVQDHQVDIAFFGPASLIALLEKSKNLPILARLEMDGRPFFQGKIIVRQESSIAQLSDLVGKRFAFGDRQSTMSHLIPRHMLLKAGITTDKLQRFQFLKNHNNVAMGVLSGDFDAGAVKEEVFEQFASQGLRVLASTPNISEHAFIARPDLPAQLIIQLRSALLDLHKTQKGRNILIGIKKNITALVPANPSDYQNLQSILSDLKKAGIL
ncbi:MAG: phosphate/phosphite/phosphonate ABC transporter substrate-binding protein [Magnetococcales bacterium]|nr:phosphate/phosphite/phosphonate ABC transporter substrate-binding protein [Magnetococcales bacterium]